MATLEEIVNQLESLTPESLDELGRYVRYLKWRQGPSPEAAAGQPWAFDFVEHFRRAMISADHDPSGMEIQVGEAACDGDSRMALWQHPPIGLRVGGEWSFRPGRLQVLPSWERDPSQSRFWSAPLLQRRTRPYPWERGRFSWIDKISGLQRYLAHFWVVQPGMVLSCEALFPSMPEHELDHGCSCSFQKNLRQLCWLRPIHSLNPEQASLSVFFERGYLCLSDAATTILICAEAI